MISKQSDSQTVINIGKRNPSETENKIASGIRFELADDGPKKLN